MSRLSRCRDRVAALEAALAECVAKRDALTIENANLTADVARLTADLQATLEDLHVANVNLAECRAKNVDLTDQVAVLKQQLADCQNPPEPPPPTGMPYMVGISRSVGGLSDSEGDKRAACKERFDQFGAQVGKTGTQMRALSGRHVYYTGPNLPANLLDIGVVKNCRDDGYGNIMFTASRLTDRAGRAAGTWNDKIKDLLRSKHADTVMDKMMFMVNFDHEPSNDQDPWDPAQWCKVQAQAAKAIFELNDPTVYYTTCHIPSAADPKWSYVSALKQIAPNNWQAILDRTYLGLDPYPEAEAGNPPTFGTVWGRIDRAVTIYRNAGETGPTCFPEVAMFHYDDTGDDKGPVPMTPEQQAKRLHDNFCVELPPKCDLRAYWYFDVTDVNNPRGDTRILQTAEEQKEYAQQILGLHR
jgi:hypothetical protein